MTGRDEASGVEWGFTLVELVVAVAITLLIIGPITGAIIIGLRTTNTASHRLTQTRDNELVQGALPRDVFSATSMQANVAAGNTCVNLPSLLVLKWSRPTLGSSTPPTTSLQPYEVDYYLQTNSPPTTPATRTLFRQLYTGAPTCSPVPGSATVLATTLSTTAPQTAVVSGAAVTLTLTDSCNNQYAISAQERAPTTTTTSATTTTTTTTTTIPGTTTTVLGC